MFHKRGSSHGLCCASTRTQAPTKVYIIIYSMYGHIKQMAEAAKKGVEEVEGVEATIYQVRARRVSNIVGHMPGQAARQSNNTTSSVSAAADHRQCSAVIRRQGTTTKLDLHREKQQGCLWGLPVINLLTPAAGSWLPSSLQVAETLPAEVLEKMHAPPKPDYPIIDPHNLPEADGFM